MSANTPTFIPVNTPVIGDAEKKFVIDALESGWVSSEGPFVGAFEEQFRQYIGRRYGIAVSSGTAALDIAFSSLGLQAGDEVIVPAFTIVSCVRFFISRGITPVLVDCYPDTWTMDLEQVEEAITPKTKAILAVHIYGLAVDMRFLRRLCDLNRIWLVEDCAESLGQFCFDKLCGAYGHMSTFSFYPNKTITTGEGGMVLTDDAGLDRKLRSYRNLCFGEEERFRHEDLGWNYRMTNVQAAIGLGQLSRIDQAIHRKLTIGRRYFEELRMLTAIQVPEFANSCGVNYFWVFGLVVEDGRTAKEVMVELARLGIGTRPFFYSLFNQPIMTKVLTKTQRQCPVAEKLSNFGLYIPSGIGLTDDEQSKVIEAVKQTFAD